MTIPKRLSLKSVLKWISSHRKHQSPGKRNRTLDIPLATKTTNRKRRSFLPPAGQVDPAVAAAAAVADPSLGAGFGGQKLGMYGFNLEMYGCNLGTLEYQAFHLGISGV